MVGGRQDEVDELKRLASVSIVPSVAAMMIKLAMRVQGSAEQVAAAATTAANFAARSTHNTRSGGHQLLQPSSPALFRPNVAVKQELFDTPQLGSPVSRSIRSSLRIASATSMFDCTPPLGRNISAKQETTVVVKQKPKTGSGKLHLQPKTPVLVMWEGKEYKAEVIRRNSRSKKGLYDVDFLDGSVGWRLSVEEHGLTRLPRPITSSRVETAKKKKSVANFKTTGEKGCSVSGCSFLAKARGVCNRHRGGSIGSAGGQGGVHTSGSRLRRIVLRPVEKPDAEEKIFTTAGAACDFLKSGKPQFYAAMQSGKAYKGWFVLDEGGEDGRRQTQKKRAICATKGCSSNAHLRDHCRKHFKITVQSRSGLARPLILRSAKNPRVEKRFGSTSAATTFLKYGRNCSTSCVYRAINSGDALKGWYIFDEGQQRVRQSPALPKPVTRKGIAAQRSGTVILRSAKNLVIVKRFDDMANAGTFLKCGRKGSTMISNSMNSGDALRGWYIFDASQQQTQRMVYLTSAESPEAEKIFSSTFDAARFFDCTFQTINAAILSRKAFRGWHISATRKATNQTASKKALPPATKKPAKRRPITPKTPTPSKKERQQHTGPRMAVLHSARTTTAKDPNHAQDFSTKKQSGKREKPTTESTGSAPTKRQRKRQEIVLTDAMDSNHVIICESIAVAMKHMATTSYKSFYKCLREGVVFQDKWYVTYTTDGNEGSKRLKKVVADASGKAKAGSNLARSSAPKSKSKSRAFKSKKGVRSLLPLNWKSAVDKKSGQTYYYHKVTKAVTWDRPPAETPSTAPAPARETNTAVHAKRNQTPTLTLTPTPTTTPMPTVSIASIAASIAGPVFLRLSVGTAVEVSLADGSTQKAFILRRDKVLKTYDVQFDDKTVTAPSTNLARPCIRVIAVDLAKAVLLIKKEPVNDSFPDEGPAPS